jgi:hypothetical protein
LAQVPKKRLKWAALKVTKVRENGCQKQPPRLPSAAFTVTSTQPDK